MRQIVLFAIGTIAALWLQTELRYWTSANPLIPDLVLILAVDLGLKQHNALAPALAFAMGYATDACSGPQLGLNAFLMTMIFLLSYGLSRHVWVTGRLIGPLTVALACILKNFAVLVISGGLSAVVQIQTASIELILLQAGVTAAVSLFVFSALAKGKRLLRLPVRVEAE